MLHLDCAYIIPVASWREERLHLACPSCERLEREYDSTIRAIYSVIDKKFKSLAEKVGELFRWQDLRDETIERLYEHKRVHRAEQFNRKEAA